MIEILTAITLAMAPVAADPRGAVEPAPVPTAQATAKADTKRYCIVETLTGSRMPQRICHTRAEWLTRGTDPLVAD